MDSRETWTDGEWDTYYEFVAEQYELDEERMREDYESLIADCYDTNY